MRELDAPPSATPKLHAAAMENPQPNKDDLDDVEDELSSEEISELVDRLDILRRHVDDLRLNVEDPILARRDLRNIEEEVDQVKAAMAAADGDRQP